MTQETTISEEIREIKQQISELKALVEGLVYAYNHQYSIPEPGDLPYPPLKVTC